MKRLLQPLRWALPALLLAGLGANAQRLNYTPGGATNVAGTYTDLGTTGTAIVTTSTDDANSAAQPIGFGFRFNGTTFNDFVLNTNGLVRLGTAAPSVANLFLSQDQSAGQTAVDPVGSTNAANTNLLMPFNIDLVSGTSPAQYRVLTSGTSPNRVCTVQWKNVSDKVGSGTDTAPVQYTNFSFQLKLYEGTNNVEFVYGPATASTGVATSRFPNVGIKGNNAASAVLANKTTGAAAWSTTVFINGPYTTTTHNFRNVTLPDQGRTYRFVPAVLPANDAEVTVVYTLGKVSSAYGSPHVVQAVVTNLGTTALTNRAVTLAVTGATTFTNTQTIASLASGAATTVTFAGYQVTGNTGTNNLSVSVPADDVLTNNSKTATQAVTTGDMSYIQGTTYDGGAGLGAANALLVARHTAVTAGALNNVKIHFEGAVANATYQVVVYAGGTTPGALLYTSGTRPRPAATGDDVVNIPSVAIPAGSFFVGTKNVTATNLSVGYQTEVPLRDGVFLFSGNGTTWTDVNTTTLNSRLAIDVTLGAAAACPALTSLTATGITATSATLNFTATSAATSYAVTVTPQGGVASTQTASGSPLTLSNLTPNTTYTVSVVANCAAGQTSAPTAITFTTALGAPAYAALPYAESFEGPWINGGGVRNLPSAFWRSSPVSGDSSWRRNDDGVSAGWGLPNGGANTPAATQGTFAARFHSFFAPDGSTGELDLYVNMSAAGTKTLSFDYVNKTGVDSLAVLISTDGGATFSATPVLLAGISATYALKTAVIASTSATTVLRFIALSDFGDDDISMDNLRITVAAPAVCNAVTNLTAASRTNGTSAFVTFTPSATATSYTVTYQQLPGGAVVPITPNPTASPVTITGLTVNTTYLISVTSNCPNGQASAASTTPLRTVLAAREALGNGALAVYPNPAQGSFVLTLPALAGERTAAVTLLNALGQTVYSRALELNAAGTETRVDVSSLTKGVYTLRVKTSNQTATKAVVVE